MKCPTFEELYARKGTREEYDPVSRLRYIRYDRLVMWENGNVDLEQGFTGDPSARRRWGKYYRLSVHTASELPTQSYDFVAPDGYRVKKADLSQGGDATLLVDWDQKLAVSLDAGWKQATFADSGIRRLVRWVHPNARPHVHARVQLHVADTEKTAERRAYLKSIRDPAKAMLKVMGVGEAGGWCPPEWRAVFTPKRPLQEILDWAASLNYSTDYALSQIHAAATQELAKPAERKPATYPYLNVKEKS